MQKSKIEWCTHTSNPVRGKCLHKCPYCYAERIRQRFDMPEEVSFHRSELEQIRKRKKPSVIFIGSMHDVFGEWVPSHWIREIIRTTLIKPEHKFIFLTKNPLKMGRFSFPDNCWVGSTVTSLFDTVVVGKNSFISAEPLIEDVVLEENIPVDVIIVGAMTGPNSVKPKKEWVENILKNQRNVFLKDNIKKIFPDLESSGILPWMNNA